jgi:hypothetical protein
MRAQLHDQIVGTDLKKLHLFDEVKVNNDGDLLFESDREVLNDFFPLFKLFKWNSKILEEVIDLFTQIVWEIPGLRILITLLKIKVITHCILVFAVDESSKVSIVNFIKGGSHG